jgi:hypothetical protein
MRVVAIAIAATGVNASVRAQATATGAPAVRVAYEWRRDRFAYRFENGSSFDTEFLVPHNYEQRYRPSGHWIVAAARYRALGDRMETGFGITPGRAIGASDIDTFYNPGDDIIRSGTDGRADWRAWRVEHSATGSIAGIAISVGYGYRRDRADFLPADIVVTHSSPPSTTRTHTVAREMTTSEQHRIPVRATHERTLGASWSVEAHGELTPMVRARLTTELPDKYPGRKIRSDAVGFGAAAEVRLVRRTGLPLFVGILGGRDWSYGRANRFSSSELSLTAGVEVR